MLSPFKEPSPNTMDRKLATGARDLVVGVDGNIEELKSDVLTEVPLNDNYFAMKDGNLREDGKVEVICNKNGNVEVICNKDEKLEVICNKNVEKVEANCNRKLESECNGTLIINKQSTELAGSSSDTGPIRKRQAGPSCLRKFILGAQASREVLNSRAVPDGQSPKRSIPMEIDESPRKKVCLSKKNEGLMERNAASPSLKPKQICTPSTTKPKNLRYRGKVAARLNWDGVDDIKCAEEDGRGKKDGKKQPLISSFMPNKNNKQEMDD